MNNGSEPQMPYSEDGERGLICSLLIAPGKVHKACAAVLRPEAFYIPAHRIIYEVIADWLHPERRVDFVWLCETLQKEKRLEEVGGKEYLSQVWDFVQTEENYEFYLKRVIETFHERQVIAIGRELARAHFNAALLHTLQEKIHALLVESNGSEMLPRPVSCESLPNCIPPIVIDGILYQGGKMIISAPSKAFKTWLVLDLLFCVANGFPWWGRKTRKGPVLLLNFELPDWDLRRRLERIREAYNEGSLADIKVVHLRGRNFKLGDLNPLARQLHGEKVSLIVIDPVYKLLSGLNESDTGDIITFCNAAEAFAASLNASIAMTHHFSKGNASAKDPIDRASGSGVWARDPDTLLTLTPNETEDCYTVSAILRSFPPIDEFVVRWQYPIYTSARDINPGNLRISAGGRPPKYTIERLVELLDTGETCSFADFKARAIRIMKCGDNTFKRLLSDALQQKAIFKDTNGCYQINTFKS
jgi:AAA domain/DnaB-like helicase N terminal domain